MIWAVSDFMFFVEVGGLVNHCLDLIVPCLTLQTMDKTKHYSSRIRTFYVRAYGVVHAVWTLVSATCLLLRLARNGI